MLSGKVTWDIAETMKSKPSLVIITLIIAGIMAVVQPTFAQSGATIELDKKVYTWTDKVFITIRSPDHNFDSNAADTIHITVSTRDHRLDNYRLVETGANTGVFSGEVILTGFDHDATGDGISDATGVTNGMGPTNGRLAAENDDGLTVAFEFAEDETVVGSALIRWNIGQINFTEPNYPASGTGVVRVIDPDMNFQPELVNVFKIDVWSDSDAGGIALTVVETGEATGIFEGTVTFSTTQESSGDRLRVAEDDTVTAEYEDRTLPDPYTTTDELEIIATTFIGTIATPPEPPPREQEPIAGFPYQITLIAKEGNFDNVEYKIKFDFEEDFEITKIISGSFNNSTMIDPDTVVFKANKMLPKEERNGVVGIFFKDSTKTDRKGTFAIDVTANGMTKGMVVDPGIGEIQAIIEVVGDAFELVAEFYDSTVSCFNLDVSSVIDLVGDLSPVYLIDLENCSEHPERVELSATGKFNQYSFSKTTFDLPQSTEDETTLTLIIPSDSEEGVHTFTVRGNIIFNFFDRTWVVTYSNGTGLYEVKEGKVIPEFPLPLLSLAAAIIPFILFSRKKKIF